MILHPGILALLLSSALIFLVMLVAGILGLKILLRWNPASNEESQLLLERRTWLVSSLIKYAFGLQIVTAVLFVFTADDIHRLFVGAMCATGSLNANLVGWLVLLTKGLLLFLAAFWVVINHLDQQTEDAPLVRVKYLSLLLILPIVGLDFYLQWSYFTGLRPEVITSCCGSLFSAEGESVASELAAMPAEVGIPLFFSVLACYLGCLAACLAFRNPLLRHVQFVLSVLMFFVALVSILSFMSPYIYQLPSHHCPFDMLQANYGFIGYPMYAGLFAATIYGMLPAICLPFGKKHQSFGKLVDRSEKRWLWTALTGMLIFVVLGCWQMVFGSLSLLGSY